MYRGNEANGRKVLLRILAIVTAGSVLSVCGCSVPWKRTVPPVGNGLTVQERQRFAQAESRLVSADPAVREQAAVALLSMDHPAGLDVVLKAMRQAEDADVRISMIRAAAFYADHRCFGTLLASIGDPDVQVRTAAATALARFTRPEEVDALMALVRRVGVPAEQTQLLFRALGDGLALKATPVLIEGLQSADEGARAAALEALRRISGRQLPADPAQWQAWWDTNAHRAREELLEEHLQALSRQLDERTGQLGDLREQHAELMALAASSEVEAPRRLTEALTSRHAAVRQFASFRLAALDQQKVAAFRIDDRDVYETLRTALEDDSPNVRQNVIRFVVRVQGNYRDELIRQALSDQSEAVVVPAVEAVDAATGPAAVVRLQELVQSSPHEAVREAAANMLGRVGSSESVPALMAALADEAEDVRWFAVEGLRKLSGTQAVPRISDMLETDASPRVREVAARALGELGQPGGVPALRKALRDRNERVQQQAVAALLALATDNYEWMSIIAQALRENGLYEPAAQVLRRIVDQFGEQPGMAASLAQTYRQLAEVLKADGNLTGAADAYQRLDALLMGSLEVRRELIDCWLKAEQAAALVAGVGQWLSAAEGADVEPLIELACEAAEQLADADLSAEARAVLTLANDAATEDTAPRLKARLERLDRRLGGTSPVEVP